MAKAERKKVSKQIWLEREQTDALSTLSQSTRVPFSAYVREAIDDLLKKYKVKPKRGKR